MKILGIDPGLSGGAAIYAPPFSLELRWQIIDLPTVGELSQRRILAPALRDWIMQHAPDHAFVEQVSAMPKQGVSSGFRFGRAAGAIDAVIACCGVPVTYIAPQRWKKFHGLKGSDKEASRARALQLAPDLSSLLARKKDHGRAEAVLIALYGHKLLTELKN